MVDVGSDRNDPRGGLLDERQVSETGQLQVLHTVMRCRTTMDCNVQTFPTLAALLGLAEGADTVQYILPCDTSHSTAL